MSTIDIIRIARDIQRARALDVTTANDWQWLIVTSDGGHGSLLQRIVVTNRGTDTNALDIRVAESIEAVTASPGDPADITFPWKLIAAGTSDAVADGDDIDIEPETISGAYAIGIKSSVADSHTTARIAVRLVQ